MKSSKYTIRIDSPCHENWHQMSDAEKGKHCAACNKNIIDFSILTDAEIIQYIESNKEAEMCGRFNTSQIERPLLLQDPIFNMPRYNRLFAGLLTISTIAFTAACHNYQPQENKHEVKEENLLGVIGIDKNDIKLVKDDNSLMHDSKIAKNIIFKGKVIDMHSNKGIPNVIINFNDSSLIFKTDEFGHFKKEIPTNLVKTTNKIIVTASLYNLEELNLSKNDLNEFQHIQLNQYEMKTMGIMYIDEK